MLQLILALTLAQTPCPEGCTCDCPPPPPPPPPPPVEGLAPEITSMRLTGPAPFAAVFDASSSASEQGFDTWHELAYHWDFGDGSGNWPHSGFPRREERGPVAAHVYETPGTYTVTLTATDPDGRVSQALQQVTVTDPSAHYLQTWCVSPDGDFDGCPSGASELVGDWDALQGLVTPGVRVLLDDVTWQADSTLTLDADDFELGSYGPGRAFLEASGLVGHVLGDQITIRDIEICQMGGAKGFTHDAANGVPGDSVNTLFLRVESGGPDNGTLVDYYAVTTNATGPPRHHQGLVIQECEVRDTKQGAGVNGLFVIMSHGAILGCEIERVQEHCIRAPYIHRSIVAHNRLHDWDQSHTAIKCHGPVWESGFMAGLENSFGVIRANTFRAGVGDGVSVSMAPTNGSANEHINDIILESNHWIASAQGSALLRVAASRLTIRNNIFDISDPDWFVIPIRMLNRGPHPPATGNRIIHNTVFNRQNERKLVHIYSDIFDTEVINNLIVSEGEPDSAIIGISQGTGTIEQGSHVSDALASDFFLSPNPTVPQDYRLQAGASAVDAGVATVDAITDFNGLQRVVPDCGAFER